MKTPHWRSVWILAMAWAVVPAVPGLLSGEFLGHGLTDLFPSVWGLWWFVQEQPGLPTHCAQLGAPDGIPFYFSSPLRGWLAWPLMKISGLLFTWNSLVVAARAATVLCAYGAARAWNLSPTSALMAAAVYGASPYFHGYTVEGIVEGQDGWALALYLWALGARRHVLAGLALGLTLWSSWYAGATACIFAALLGPRGWWSLWGIGLALPPLYLFGQAFPGDSSVNSAVRTAMGTQLSTWTPGIAPGLNPFAKTSWIGFIAPALALTQLRKKPWIVALMVVFLALSTGWGPWFELPPLEQLRFPYRLHAGTLACLGALSGLAIAHLGRRGPWIVGAVVIEGLLLSPVEPIVPTAAASVPELYNKVGDTVVLDIPGPVSLAPGVENPSRARARHLLYAQTVHTRPSPWVPDFNGIGITSENQRWLGAVAQLDPLVSDTLPTHLEIPENVGNIVLHRHGLGDRIEPIMTLLGDSGFELFGDDGERLLLHRVARLEALP